MRWRSLLGLVVVTLCVGACTADPPRGMRGDHPSGRALIDDAASRRNASAESGRLAPETRRWLTAYVTRIPVCVPAHTLQWRSREIGSSLIEPRFFVVEPGHCDDPEQPHW